MTSTARPSDADVRGEALPPIRHARDCAYVVSSDPAPCTCDFYAREQKAVAALRRHLMEKDNG